MNQDFLRYSFTFSGLLRNVSIVLLLNYLSSVGLSERDLCNKYQQ